MTAAQRPRAVAAVAWGCIAWGLVKLALGAWLLASPRTLALSREFAASQAAAGPVAVAFELQLGHLLAGAPVLLAGGVGLLHDRAWAAWLLVAWMASALLLTLLVAGPGPGLALHLGVAGLLAWLLLRPAARAGYAARR